MISGTCEVAEWQVRLGEVSGTNHHCVKNMSLPLTLSFCLHLPLACHSKVWSLPHTEHSSLRHTNRHTCTHSAEYTTLYLICVWHGIYIVPLKTEI